MVVLAYSQIKIRMCKSQVSVMIMSSQRTNTHLSTYHVEDCSVVRDSPPRHENVEQWYLFDFAIALKEAVDNEQLLERFLNHLERPI